MCVFYLKINVKVFWRGFQIPVHRCHRLKLWQRYKIINALASMGLPDAVTAYNLLKERFANQGGAPADPDTP
jgi:hypothetical protein